MTDTNLVSIERYPAVGSSSHHWKSRLTMTCQRGEEADVFKLIADIGLYSRTPDSQKEMKPPGESTWFWWSHIIWHMPWSIEREKVGAQEPEKERIWILKIDSWMKCEKKLGIENIPIFSNKFQHPTLGSPILSEARPKTWGANYQVTQLSGGMKRKLSVGLAFSGEEGWQLRQLTTGFFHGKRLAETQFSKYHGSTLVRKKDWNNQRTNADMNMYIYILIL